MRGIGLNAVRSLLFVHVMGMLTVFTCGACLPLSFHMAHAHHVSVVELFWVFIQRMRRVFD